MTPKALSSAIGCIERWIEFQMRHSEQPGCALAIAHRGRLVFEGAWGHANLARGEALTPRHRFRVASHSKTFTAAAALLLRDEGRWQLDDAVGRHVEGLHPDVAATTLAQLLSHSAGMVRDGPDAGQWAERRPFLDEAALRADLKLAPTIEANTRFKYSNHGYGLVGLAIEAVTGERYADWVQREIVGRAGLHETAVDAPLLPNGARLAHGHSAKLPLGRRAAVPARMSTQALAAATGFVSTAADLARFFASLDPDARRSVLSRASRLEMTRRLWPDPHGTPQRWYGLGTMAWTLAGMDGAWQGFGHTGGFPGTITRTTCIPSQQLCLSVLTNAADGASHAWLDGALHLLQAHARHGAPSRRTEPWRGRFWSPGGAFDLVPLADRVLVATPALAANPLQDASEIAVGARCGAAVEGRISLGGGYASHGEPARLDLDARGRAKAFWHGGTRLVPEAAMVRELSARYGGK